MSATYAPLHTAKLLKSSFPYIIISSLNPVSMSQYAKFVDELAKSNDETPLGSLQLLMKGC